MKFPRNKGKNFVFGIYYPKESINWMIYDNFRTINNFCMNEERTILRKWIDKKLIY